MYANGIRIALSSFSNTCVSLCSLGLKVIYSLQYQELLMDNVIHHIVFSLAFMV